MPSSWRIRVRWAVALGILVLLALAVGQTLRAQPPGDPYYEHDGMWCGRYDIDPGRARLAVLAALTNMHMPVFQEGFLAYGSFLDTKTVDNFQARITIVPPGHVGAGTQVCVRIGGFGTHRQVCARILDEVSRQMDTARRVPANLVLPAPVRVTGPAPPVILVPQAPPAPPVPQAAPAPPVPSALPPEPIPVQ